MSGSSQDASTAGMKAKGYYDAHSEYQRRVIEGGDELIRSTVSGMDLDRVDGALTIADYGAGTGATSVHAVGTAIEALRDRDAERPVMAIHNDVLGNDFTQLFSNVASDGGYLSIPGGSVYSGAAAGSFFSQVVPSASVQLGMCSNASHWLSAQPAGVSIPDGMYFCEAQGEAREALAHQAGDDWLAFLEARAAELAPGGRLVVQGIASSDDGERGSASRLLRVMWEAADALAGEGKLDRGRLEGYVFPVYCRSPVEATAPLQPGAPLENSLEVLAERMEEVANPYWEAFEKDADSEAYAKTYVEFVRAFAESTLMEHLFEPGAKGIAPAALCDEYFERLRAATAADPEAGRYEAWILRLALGRL